MFIRDFLNRDVVSIIFVFPPLLLISLFTLFLKEEVFRAWWRFARWSVPTLMFFTYVLNGSGGGNFGIGGSGDFVLIWLLYIIFFITSFTIIVRATYRTAGQ